MEDRNVIVIQSGLDCYVFVHDPESAYLVSPAAAMWAANPELPTFKWHDAAVVAHQGLPSYVMGKLTPFQVRILRALDKDRAKRSEISGTA